MVATPRPPRLIAESADEVLDVALGVGRLSRERFLERRGRRMVEISAIPFLRASPEGARFLQLRGARALARGEPAASCPAAASSPAGAPDRASAASEALGACFAQLRSRGAGPECGCRVIAADDMLFARPGEFSFAPAVSAVLLEDDRPARRLVADVVATDPSGKEVILRDASRDVATVRLEGEEAALTFIASPDAEWRGARAPFGYRRGRLAERIVFENRAGETFALLIGVERRDALPR